jgi:quercetin dioxygenase-like cupin family protein
MSTTSQAISPPPPPIRRIVTSHNDQAKAYISRDDLLLAEPQAHGNIATLLWSSDTFPADVMTTADMSAVSTGIVNNGSVLRVVDFPPRSKGKLHRTISQDYIVVLKGTVVLTLDDGSKTPVTEGGVVVQRATMHGWDNDTDEWARILCVLVPARAPVVGGVELQTHMTFEVK